MDAKRPGSMVLNKENMYKYIVYVGLLLTYKNIIKKLKVIKQQ